MDGGTTTACAIDIISDDDENEDSSLQGPPKKASKMDGEGHRRGRPPPTIVVVDDGVTPQKENPVRTPYFVPETPISPENPFDSDPSIVKCSLARARVANDSSDFSGDFLRMVSFLFKMYCLMLDGRMAMRFFQSNILTKIHFFLPCCVREMHLGRWKRFRRE